MYESFEDFVSRERQLFFPEGGMKSGQAWPFDNRRYKEGAQYAWAVQQKEVDFYKKQNDQLWEELLALKLRGYE